MEAVEKEGGAEESVGALLKKEREARHLGLGDVAERLKLSVRQLEAIERDDYAALPGPTFVRGFVRNYARFLEMDSAALMHRLDQSFPPVAAETAIVQQQAADASASTSRLPSWLVVLVAVGVVACAGWWFFARNGDAAEADLSPMLTEASAASGIVDAPDESMASAPAQDVPAVTASTALGEQDAVPPVDASEPSATVRAPQAAASAPVAVAAGAAALRLVADADAWVSVTDAKGEKLMFGTLKAGEQKLMAGTPPYRVRIGNASRVKLYYKDQPVDFSGKIRGSTATIKLD